MAKITIKKFKECAVDSYGIQSVIAKRMGVTRGAVSIFLSKNPKLQVILDQESEKIIDVAENRLFKKINGGNIAALKFFLETKGKHRGYIPRSEVQSEHTENISINFGGGLDLGNYQINTDPENQPKVIDAEVVKEKKEGESFINQTTKSA